MRTLISIIIRTKNEARWIGQCLEKIKRQHYNNFEIILVDNNSTDHTLDIASDYHVKNINIDRYKPGLAINKGIESSSGEIIVVLSGHCIPTNEFWLENLTKELVDKNIAGIYGRQEPLTFSSDSDKRDLSIVFGLDKKIQKKDSFFHNANSAFTREVWKKFPFDHQINHIEDRLWGKKVIEAGYKIIYEPKASVYHYHGIHQNNHPIRLKNIVKILEDHEVLETNKIKQKEHMTVIIPINDELDEINGYSSLFYLKNIINESNYLNINRTVIVSNLTNVRNESKKLGFEFIYNRNPKLCEPFVTVNEVIADTIINSSFDNLFNGSIIYMSPKNLLRTKTIIDGMISKFLDDNYDVLFPVYNERRSVWIKSEKSLKLVEKQMPTKLKSGIEISISGLCTISNIDYYLSNDESHVIGLFQIEDPTLLLDLKNSNGKKVIQKLLDK